ncbi:helix-hairpin-helix domain-containing protein [Candidatus Sumerlaeota bacterium]|nr:helix-hairpin-helix domain-containing protein [Candidatus Sumerlaeota bacterium]
MVRLRESRGGFSRLEELFDVEGIGQKTFERIEPLVTVVPRASAAPRQDSPATTATIPAHVPVVAPVATAAPSSGASRAAPPGRVNINLADAEELETLWNVGPTKARAITEWRERHGPFKRPEDLTLVPGIGPQTLKRNLDRIAVEPFVRPADSAAFPSGSSPESRR